MPPNLRGHGIGWRDLEGQIVAQSSGAGFPAWSTIAGNFKGWKFALNDVFQIAYHLPHDFVAGSGVGDGYEYSVLFPHVHFTTDGTNTAVVRFSVEYSYAPGFNQGNYTMTGSTPLTINQTPHGTALRSYVAEHGTGIDGSSYQVDGLLLAIYKRITNGGTDNTDGVFVQTVDLHYRSIMSGGTTPLKAPPFI